MITPLKVIRPATTAQRAVMQTKRTVGRIQEVMVSGSTKTFALVSTIVREGIDMDSEKFCTLICAIAATIVLCTGIRSCERNSNFTSQQNAMVAVAEAQAKAKALEHGCTIHVGGVISDCKR